MKETQGIRTPIEYKFEKIEKVPHTHKYRVVVSANSHGVKIVEARKKELQPLMNCTSSLKLGKMIGKHIIDNEVGCSFLEEIRNTSFSKI